MKNRRTKKLIRGLILDYQSKMETQLENDGSLNVTFPQYVGLVRNFTSSFLDYDWSREGLPVIFTALCITPWQWFNYNLRPVPPKKAMEVASLSDIEVMEVDPYWADYHKFLINLRCGKSKDCKKPISKCVSNEESCFQRRSTFRFYRYILTVNPTVIAPKDIPVRYSFPRSDIVDIQFGSHYILFPTESDKLTINLQDPHHKNLLDALGGNESLLNLYRNKEAYLLIDKPIMEDLHTWLESSTYKSLLVKEAFNLWFHQDPHPKYVKLNYSIALETFDFIKQNRLSEDFIIFGVIQESGRVSWLYCLASDITADTKMAQLSILFGKNQPRLRDFRDLLIDHLGLDI